MVAQCDEGLLLMPKTKEYEGIHVCLLVHSGQFTVHKQPAPHNKAHQKKDAKLRMQLDILNEQGGRTYNKR